MLAWITMMSSCAVMISPAGPMGYHHGGYGHVCFRPGCCGFGGWGDTMVIMVITVVMVVMVITAIMVVLINS